MQEHNERLMFALRNALQVELIKIPPKIKNMKMKDFLSNDQIALPSTAKKSISAMMSSLRDGSATPFQTPKFKSSESNNVAQTPLNSTLSSQNSQRQNKEASNLASSSSSASNSTGSNGSLMELEGISSVLGKLQNGTEGQEMSEQAKELIKNQLMALQAQIGSICATIK
eukprot:TRINITY_DN3771_c0_g1_i1.p1 TRINITY_DN3771_c0_g1~~TRINITY_DN3771_c0_g1_i1.p1  ORF type:complete len:170 (+),score=74.91 TRINITY_DN3771_c0_g1_i1:118-627(+)